MKTLTLMYRLLGAVVLLANVACTGNAADLSQPMTLVATSRLAGSMYEQAVLVVAPITTGHVGFILNRQTRIKLEEMFPGHGPSRQVAGPISLGGPMFPEMVVALVREAPASAAATIPLMSNLVAVIDGKSVDHVIETTPNEARYFAGLVIWAPGELDHEIRGGAWNVRPANADLVFSISPENLWKELAGTSQWI